MGSSTSTASPTPTTNEINYSFETGILSFNSAQTSTAVESLRVGEHINLRITNIGTNAIVYLTGLMMLGQHVAKYANSTDVVTSISEAHQLAIDFSFEVIEGPNGSDTAANQFKISSIASTSSEVSLYNPDQRSTLTIYRIGAASGATVTLFKKILHGSGARTSNMSKKINVYSFALKPEEHQPSGSCNFSRIDSAFLEFSASSATTVYAVNYNVLRIMSGMGGLAYSN